MVIAEVLAVTPRATPLFGSIVATVVVSEVQVTGLAGGWVVPSLNISIAVKSVVVPVEMFIVAGVIANEVAAAGPTVSVAVPTVMPSQLVAVMLMGPPVPTVVALPV